VSYERCGIMGVKYSLFITGPLLSFFGLLCASNSRTGTVRKDERVTINRRPGATVNAAF